MITTNNQQVDLTALIIRERLTRFAGGAFGPLWAYATPVAWITFVVISFNLLGRASPLASGAEIFVATGILPYVLFRQTITSMMRTLIANRYLLYFQPMTTQNILFAAALVELLNTIVTSVVIFGTIILFFYASMPSDVLTVYFAMGLAWALGVSAGSLFAAVGRWSDSISRAIPLMLRPLFWISGIFFVATELPLGAQQLLAWNPLFHVIEILREGFFLGYVSPVADPAYVCIAVIVMFGASLLVDRFVSVTHRERHLL